MSGFAKLPEPPYFVVIFSSQRNGEDEAGYAAAAERMLELAAQQPGFLGAESARGTDGFGITVSYWDSEAAIGAWKHHAEHAATRAWAQALVRTFRAARGQGHASLWEAVWPPLAWWRIEQCRAFGSSRQQRAPPWRLRCRSRGPGATKFRIPQ